MDILRELLHEIQDDDVPGLAAELAYRFLFALFPFFIFLAALGGFAASWLHVQNPTQEVMSRVATSIPPSAAGFLRSQLESVLGSAHPGLLSFGAIAALWASSSGVKSTIKAMNRAYDVDEGRPFVRKQALGIGLTLLAGAAFVAGFALLVVGQFAGDHLARSLGLGGAWGLAVAYARFPVTLLVLFVAMLFVYRVAPNVRIPMRRVVVGSLLFVVTWVLATAGFAVYVSRFGAYQATYGAAGTIIVLMMWLYITSFIMLVGAELNAILHAHAEPQTIGLPSGETAADRERRLHPVTPPVETAGPGAEPPSRFERPGSATPSPRETPRRKPAAESD